MVTGTLSVCVWAVMLVMLWLNDVNCQGLNGRRGAEIRCFTEEDKIEILKVHNDYRRASNSSNMRKMEWNDDLEAMSQLFIDGCTFEHNSDELTDKFGFRHIGENLYVSGGDFYQVKDAVDQWHSEIDNYDYDTGDCNGVCGHYTQIVWDDTYALGCGLIWCADLKGIPQIPKGVLIICNYGPGGNVPLAYPYEQGEACSNCSATASFCSDGLCTVTSNGSSSVSTANKCPAPLSGNATTSGNVEPSEITTSGNVLDSSTSGDIRKGDENTLTAEILENIAIFLFVSGAVIVVSSFLYMIRFSGTNLVRSDSSQPLSTMARSDAENVAAFLFVSGVIIIVASLQFFYSIFEKIRKKDRF